MRFAGLAIVAGVAMFSVGAFAQTKSNAENGLIGIKLFDPESKVLSTYGTPDEIQPINVGGGAAFGGPGGGGGGQFGPGGGAGGRGGPGRPGGPGMGPMGGPGMGGGGRADLSDPFEFGDSLLQTGSMLPPAPKRGLNGGGGGGGVPGGIPGAPMGGPPGGMRPPGAPGGGGFNPGNGGGAGAPRGGGGASEEVNYTRLVYNRAGSKYGFVIDKYGRVVQIDAIGIQNGKVRTSRGIGFGATFAQIMKKYPSPPDAYDIAGDNVTVKYLSKNRVAFRLSRLGDKKPQVVTGIVVAASKS